ncbi:hypothetical protein RHMOL_Rhmol07G0199200 [Rhododendron molle]|uniref:Uncharacterized protein n=1 Tax=Rhododendron molle TaxID=49168 RepID=A0ACC0N4M3_RHOML|nr:hypothetical protein RHMOL_Rhmol07G0199200 [Rhododendron molle]
MQSGLDVFNDIISDLHDGSVPSVRLDPASTCNVPTFAVAPPDPSQDFVSRFRAVMPALPEPEPELDMQAVGWAIADSEDYTAPLIQEWFQLELEGFPLHLEQAPPDPAWEAEWIAQHE